MAEEDEDAVNMMLKKLGEEKFEQLKEQMRRVSGRFRGRSQYHRDVITRPVTPSDKELEELDHEVERRREEKVLVMDDFTEEDPFGEFAGWQYVRKKYLTYPKCIHPQSTVKLAFLGMQTVVFLYNAWTIPLRACFHVYLNDHNWGTWLALDVVMDVASWWHIVFVKGRLQFLNSFGIYETDRREMLRYYLREGTMKQDLLSMMPLELFYLVTGYTGRATLLRLPRLLRYYLFGLFFDRLDAALPYPMLIRLLRTINIMVYLIHLNACAFYLFSDVDGIGTNSFVFSGDNHAYMRCFYVGLKTSISVGINPKPLRDNPIQMIFMGSLWLLGVFVFAVLIGNVKDIIAQSTLNQDDYMKRFDALSQYMYQMNVPNETMTKGRISLSLTNRHMKSWCQHTWETQKSFDELAILEHLPTKMRTDVALDVHYKTLKEVKLFHGCDPGLLRELVIKLQPLIFLSGDYICRKGDVGKEMFIITVGQVQVVGGPDDSIVFVTLGQGVCFGEIALLGTGGMNRRTASIKAYGHTTLYVLYKEDLQESLNDYPEDRELLARKAKKAAKEVAAKQAANSKQDTDAEAKSRDVVVPFKDQASEDPRLLRVAVQAMRDRGLESDLEERIYAWPNREKKMERSPSVESSSSAGSLSSSSS